MSMACNRYNKETGHANVSRFCSKQYSHTLVKSFNEKTKKIDVAETALTLPWPNVDHSVKTCNKITKLEN